MPLPGNVKISAIVPVYNCARYVGKAIESIFAQTHPASEIIVVDDGSTDGTRDALERYKSSITYIYQKNAGEPAARNTGMRHSSGDYIAYLDADDLWMPDKLELQLQYLKTHPNCDLVYTDMMTFDDQGIIEHSVRAARGRVYCSGKIFPQLFRETLFGSGSVLFRKEAAEKVGGFDETFLVGSDYEMWLRMARHFDFGYVDKPLLMYRQHPEMSTQKLGKIPQGGIPWQVKVLKRTLELFPEVRRELGNSAINERLAVPYMWLGRSLMDRGDHVEARRLISGAMQYDPWNPRYRLAYLATFLSPSRLTAAKKVYHRFSPRAYLNSGTKASMERSRRKQEYSE